MVSSHRRISLVICVGVVALFAGGITLALPGPAAAAPAHPARSSGPYAVTFEDSGLAAGRPWSVSVLASNGTLAGNFTTSAQSDSIDLAVGSYTYSASPPTGWSFAPRHPTSFMVSGQRTITVPFAIAGGYN